MINLERFKKLAKAHGLEVVYTTSDGNGYPRNESVGLIGFKSYAQMRDFADAHRLYDGLFWQKNGWSHWCVKWLDEDSLCVYNRPEYGEGKDCFIYRKNEADDLESELNQELESGLYEEDDDYVEYTREIIEELRKLEDGQVLVSDSNCSLEVEWEYTTEWWHDSKHFVIGVYA